MALGACDSLSAAGVDGIRDLTRPSPRCPVRGRTASELGRFRRTISSDASWLTRYQGAIRSGVGWLISNRGTVHRWYVADDLDQQCAAGGFIHVPQRSR